MSSQVVKNDSMIDRINQIKRFLKDKTIQPLINFDNTNTEYYQHGTYVSDDDVSNSDIDIDNRTMNTKNTRDTRNTLHKKEVNFEKVIKNLNSKLTYIKSGTTGHTFNGQTNDKKYEYAVKVVAYPNKCKYGLIYDTHRPENAEIMMLRCLSYFVVNKQTPHIVLPVATFNTSIEPFLSLHDCGVVDDDDSKYLDFLESHKNGEYHNEVSILISEWANKGDLLDYIRKNYKEMTLTDWRVILFQIISTLAVIQQKYPDFRHNDFKANNILLHKINLNRQYSSYYVCGTQYRVPNIGYSCRIWDFDFACIPNVVDNSKVTAEWTDRINVNMSKNRYYDIHYFLNTLVFFGFFKNFMECSYIDTKVKDFVKRVIPEKYRYKDCVHDTGKRKKQKLCNICNKYVHLKGRLLVNDEYLTPQQILSDEFFMDFRCK